MAESFDGRDERLLRRPVGRPLPRDGRHARGRFDGGRGFGGQSVTAWHYGAGVTYDVLGGDVRPFVTLGAGAVTYDGARDANTRLRRALRRRAQGVLRPGRPRIDVVDYLVVDQYLSGDTEHDVHATGGVLVRF